MSMSLLDGDTFSHNRSAYLELSHIYTAFIFNKLIQQRACPHIAETFFHRANLSRPPELLNSASLDFKTEVLN